MLADVHLWARDSHLHLHSSTSARFRLTADIVPFIILTCEWVDMQLAGAGAGAVGGALLGRASENNKQGAQGAGVQDLGGLGTGGQPGGDRQPGGQLGGQPGGQSRGLDQQPPAAQVSNVLNGGNRDPGNQGFNGNGGNGRGAGGGAAGGAGGRDNRGNTGDPGGRSAADIAATSPQSNVFRQDARTAATHPRESRLCAFHFA